MLVTNNEIYKNIENWYKNHNLTWLKENTLFVTVHGSKCYGTDFPESDTDLKGIVIPPKEYLLGFSESFEQAEASEPYDMVLFSLQKFMKLATNCNPNILEILFTDPSDWICNNTLFYKLYDNRFLFLTKNVKNTFGGYAVSQFKRMKSHRNFILSPPSHKPTRKEYGLSEDTKLSQSNLGVINNLINNGKSFSEEIMSLFQKEQRYNAAKKSWNQYQDWINTRNKKRFLLEKQMGYDGKNALHLVRLINMCKEILKDGNVTVKRPDAAFLKEIRNGCWTYEEICSWVEQQEKEIDNLYKISNLRDKPDIKKINNLCVEILEEFYQK